MRMTDADVAVVGDIGGTHARFGLARMGEGRLQLETPSTYLCRDYVSLSAALDAYLRNHGTAPGAVAVAVAGPVVDGAAHFTNMSWTVSEAGLRAAGFARASVINDYEALALAAPWLQPEDSIPLGPLGHPTPHRTLVVLGPGTGFGAAALCRDARGAAILTGEGGHVAFAPTDETEVQVWRILARRFGRVSVERILSGPGMANLYAALCEIHAAPLPPLDAAEITARAAAGDGLAVETVQRFCSILGSVCGDFALAYGAFGGVFLAGGIAPRLAEALNDGRFRSAFQDKGRFSAYLSNIPTRIVTHPYLALLGAAESLRTPRLAASSRPGLSPVA